MHYDIEIGQDVDSYCTKCMMDLYHTVVAKVDGKIKRVKCNTCGGQHNYRPPKGETDGTKRIQKMRNVSQPKVTLTPEKEWEAAILDKDISNPLTYNPKNFLDINDIINHKLFGIGIVISERANNKVMVQFRSGLKVLVRASKLI